VRAGKAYISSLGTTGVLIASSLLLLAVVGAMLAFDRWPDNAAAETDVVAITADGPASERTLQTHERTSASRASADRRTGTAGDRGRAADTGVPSSVARAASVQVAADSDPLVKTPPPADPVVTELPAPDSVDDTRPVTAPAPSPGTGTPAPDAPSPDKPSQPELPTPDEILPDPNDEAVGLSAVTAPLAESLSPLSPVLGHTVRHTGEGLDGTLSGLVEATSAQTER